jgi:hypothetical protein
MQSSVTFDFVCGERKEVQKLETFGEPETSPRGLVRFATFCVCAKPTECLACSSPAVNTVSSPDPTASISKQEFKLSNMSLLPAAPVPNLIDSFYFRVTVMRVNNYYSILFFCVVCRGHSPMMPYRPQLLVLLALLQLIRHRIRLAMYAPIFSCVADNCFHRRHETSTTTVQLKLLLFLLTSCVCQWQPEPDSGALIERLMVILTEERSLGDTRIDPMESSAWVLSHFVDKLQYTSPANHKRMLSIISSNRSSEFYLLHVMTYCEQILSSFDLFL